MGMGYVLCSGNSLEDKKSDKINKKGELRAKRGREEGIIVKVGRNSGQKRGKDF